MAQIEVLLAKYHRIGLTVAASLGIHGALMGMPMSFDAELPKPESLSVVPLEPLSPQPTSTATSALPVSRPSIPPTLPKFNPVSPFQWNSFSSASSNFGSNIASNNFPDRTATSVSNWQSLQNNRAEETLNENPDEVSETETPEQQEQTSGTQATNNGTQDNPSTTQSASDPPLQNRQPQKPKPLVSNTRGPNPSSPPQTDDLVLTEEEQQSASQQVEQVLAQLDESLKPDESSNDFPTLTEKELDSVIGMLGDNKDLKSWLLVSDESNDKFKPEIVAIRLEIETPASDAETRQKFIQPFEDQGFKIIDLPRGDREWDWMNYQLQVKGKAYRDIQIIKLGHRGTMLVVWKTNTTDAG